MMERMPFHFQSYGPAPFAPEAGHYALWHDDLWGELGKHAQNGLRAILAALMINGPLVTKTEASRQDFLDLIPEDKRPKDKRSITGYFSRLIKLGVIVRTRTKGTNIWVTELIKPFRARLDEPPADAQASLRAPKSETDASVGKPDIAWCTYAVSYCEKHGWRLIADGESDLNLEPIEGMEQDKLDADMKVLMKERKLWLRSYLEGTCQRE
jgi:hypothetical protein